MPVGSLETGIPAEAITIIIIIIVIIITTTTIIIIIITACLKKCNYFNLE